MNGAIKTKPFSVGNATFGDGRLTVIAGPCVIESSDHALMMARECASRAKEVGLDFVFKSSFDKANRSSIKSFRGLGIEAGLEVLQRVKEEVGVPVLTDVHDVSQVDRVAEVVGVRLGLAEHEHAAGHTGHRRREPEHHGLDHRDLDAHQVSAADGHVLSCAPSDHSQDGIRPRRPGAAPGIERLRLPSHPAAGSHGAAGGRDVREQPAVFFRRDVPPARSPGGSRARPERSGQQRVRGVHDG